MTISFWLVLEKSIMSSCGTQQLLGFRATSNSCCPAPGRTLLIRTLLPSRIRVASMTFGIYISVIPQCWSNEVGVTYEAGPFIFLGKDSSISPALQGPHTMIRKTKLVTVILNVVVMCSPPCFARNEAIRHLGGCLKVG